MQLTVKSDGEIINVAISPKSKLVNNVESSKYRNYKRRCQNRITRHVNSLSYWLKIILYAITLNKTVGFQDNSYFGLIPN